MRKFLIFLVIAAVLAVGGWFAYQRFLVPAQSQSSEPEFETYAVERQAILSTVSATGSIEPEDQVSLVFRAAGPIARVLVDTGEAVQEGQLLAELDTTDLTLALANSKVAEEIAQAQLAKLLVPPDPDDVAAAQAAVEVAQTAVASAEAALSSAQATYLDLLEGPNATQQTINEAQLRQAEIALKQAQQAYNKIKDQPDVGLRPEAAQLEQATVSFEVAKAQAAKTEEPATQAQLSQALNGIAQAESALRNAQAQVVNAQNNLDALLEGPEDEDITIARAQVKQAQLNQLQAENSLNNARIVAPFGGVISELNAKEGEIASAALPAVVLTNLDQFKMKVLVDEIDVRQVEVGQPVRLTIDALPGTEVTGEITEIAPTPTNASGTVAYVVTIVPDPVDAPLRVGMSATASITTAEVNDAIVVPNRFIQLDRESGDASVYKLVDGKPVRQQVELGLRNERASQILAGVAEGDEIALVTLSSEEQLRQGLFGGGN
jgi:HlyD family secretion protein